MKSMTIERLNNYGIIATQKRFIEKEFLPYINAVDLSRPAVQNGKKIDTTADIAIELLSDGSKINREYKRLTDELNTLDSYIFGIQDELTKAIAVRHFIFKETYQSIADDLNYSKSFLSQRMIDYIQNCGQSEQK